MELGQVRVIGRVSLALVASVAFAAGAYPRAAAGQSHLVQSLVAQVSTDRIRQHIEALEGPRASDETIAAASAYIAGELGSYGYTVKEQQVGRGDNLIVTIPGMAAPEHTFIVGAHYDTVGDSPGADDNASGVAALLEIARALRGYQPATNIDLVAFAEEEVGLLGSSAYAFEAGEELRQITGMLSMDMIAYTCDVPGCQFTFPNIPGCFEVSDPTTNVGTFIAAVANRASDGLLQAFLRASTVGVPELELEWGIVAGTGRCLSDTRRSDHSPFWDRGYPALLITDTANYRNRNYHRPTDTSDTLDFEFAAKVTRAVLATVLEVAAVVPPTPTPPPTIPRTPQPTPTPLPPGARVELYTTNGQEVVVFEVDRGLVTARIPVRLARDVILSPDQTTAYIAAGSPGIEATPPQVYVYDVSTRSVVDSINFSEEPLGLAISRDGQLLYISRRAILGGLTIVDRTTLEEIGSFETPGGIASAATLTSDGRTAFVLVPAYAVLAIDLETLAVRDRIELTSDPRRSILTADDATLYVPLPNANRVSVIDVAQGRHIADIPVARPEDIVADPNGTRAYIRGCCRSGMPFVAILDTHLNQIVGHIEVGASPPGELIPQRAQLFFGVNGGTIAIVDLDAMSTTTLVDRSHTTGRILGYGIRRPTGIVTPSTTRTWTPTPTGSKTPLDPCPGDCDGDQTVTVDELTKVVLLALGAASMELCSSVDVNRDGRVTIEEIIKAVDRALYGCNPSEPTGGSIMRYR